MTFFARMFFFFFKYLKKSLCFTNKTIQNQTNKNLTNPKG